MVRFRKRRFCQIWMQIGSAGGFESGELPNAPHGNHVFSPHDVPFHPFSMSRRDSDNPERCASESQDAQKWNTFLRRGEALQPTQCCRPRILSPRLCVCRCVCPVGMPRAFPSIAGYPVHRLRPELDHHRHANARSRERGHAFSALIRRNLRQANRSISRMAGGSRDPHNNYLFTGLYI